MAIIPANMDNCDPKKKCLWGDNEGIAYTSGEACPPNETFSEELCDCEGYFFCDCSCHSDCGDCELCVGGICQPDPECVGEYRSRVLYTAVTQIESCSDSNCSNGTALEVGDTQVRRVMTALTTEFDSSAVWALVDTDTIGVADSCATACGMSLPPYNVENYAPGDGVSSYPSSTHFTGGIGFNVQTNTYYEFNYVDGYGATESEAEANAIAQVS